LCNTRNQARKTSGHHKKKPQKSRQAKEKSKRKARKKGQRFRNDDHSLGDPKRIYGMSINGQEIGAALAPDKMKKSDRSTMYTASVDVASLPDGWNQTKGVSEELFTETPKMAQLTSTILQSMGKVKHMEVQDTTWNSTLRHSLGKIKNRDNVLEFMKKLRKSRKSAFQQQDNLIEHFLYRHHYSSKFIQTYLQTSFLSRITNDSFQNFFDLADAIRQLSIDLPQWEGGPAKAMLDYHAGKFWDIRQYAISRKQLVLQVYTYLRDTQAKEFHHEAMVGALWKRLNDLNSANFGSRVNTDGRAGNPQANQGDNAETRCSHCMLKELHR
jgi:hypothetical protein